MNNEISKDENSNEKITIIEELEEESSKIWNDLIEIREPIELLLEGIVKERTHLQNEFSNEQ